MSAVKMEEGGGSLAMWKFGASEVFRNRKNKTIK